MSSSIVTQPINKYLLSTYNGSGFVLDVQDTAMNKKTKSLLLGEFRCHRKQ